MDIRPQRRGVGLLSLVVTFGCIVTSADGFVASNSRQHHDLRRGRIELGSATLPVVENATTTSSVTVPLSTQKKNPVDTTIPWPLDVARYGAFQQERDWGFAYSSVIPSEACTSYIIDDIEGTIPPDLVGTYYKTGPGKFESPDGRRYEHVLDGDGFVAAFTFGDGVVDNANNNNDGVVVRYTGRFVEIEYYLKEQMQQKILYRSVFGTQRSGGPLFNAFDLTLKNVANTNIISWGHRLFTLFEAGRPYELDPETLQTLSSPTTANDEADEDGPFAGLGPTEGRLRGVTIDEGGPVDRFLQTAKSFTAHPHVLDDNTLVAFQSVTRVQQDEAVLEFIEYDQNWRKKKPSVSFAFPRGPPPHDFAISEHYYIFFENPFGPMDNMAYMLGLKSPTQMMQLLLGRSTALNLVPRDNSSSMKPLRFEVQPYFNIHTVAKAEETEDGQLILYSNGWDLTDERFFPQSQDSVPFLGSWGGPYPDFVNGIVPPSLFYKTVLDLSSQRVISHEQVYDGDVIEFPTQDAREPHVVYCSIASRDNTSMPGTGFCRYDLSAKSTAPQYWWADHRVFTGEITPVPKRNGEKGSWLLALLYDADCRRTSLAIFDSEKFVDGPIGQLHLHHHLSYGLHGSFAAPAFPTK
jgi:all-trans-8'-apo-beta-carotenal 15,15'-oxygenase